MKPPSKNLAQDLHNQPKRGRGMETVEITGLKRQGALVVPGEGGTTPPVGAGREHPMGNTAAKFAGAVGAKFGNGKV
jgi:hypothetical protein